MTSGAVRKIYTIEGRPIKRFDELEDAGTYVATSGENLKRVAYLLDTDSDGVDPFMKLKSAKALAASQVRMRVRTASYFRKEVSFYLV